MISNKQIKPKIESDYNKVQQLCVQVGTMLW
jgi:hypothetical protein